MSVGVDRTAPVERSGGSVMVATDLSPVAAAAVPTRSQLEAVEAAHNKPKFVHEWSPCPSASVVRQPGLCNERAGYAWHRCAEVAGHAGDECTCLCGETFYSTPF